MLGYELSEATVARYMIKRIGRPTLDWKTFLTNHLGETAAVDFLAVPIIMFKTLHVFVILSLERLRIVHLNVNRRSTTAWTASQLAKPFRSIPRHASWIATATGSTGTRSSGPSRFWGSSNW